MGVLNFSDKSRNSPNFISSVQKTLNIAKQHIKSRILPHFKGIKSAKRQTCPFFMLSVYHKLSRFSMQAHKNVTARDTKKLRLFCVRGVIYTRLILEPRSAVVATLAHIVCAAAYPERTAICISPISRQSPMY